MPLELLLQAGLTPTQAEILGFLLSQKELKAKDIVAALQKPRGVIYKGLDELVALGLVEKIDQSGAVARFRAEHPSKLEILFDQREKEIKKERQSFLANLPELTSHYNLAHYKPGIHFFEGETGVQKILGDTLKSKTEILTFLDQESDLQDSFFSSVNKNYQAELLKAGVQQRIIINGTRPETTSENSDTSTEIRYLAKSFSPFTSSLKIYDHKIAYQTFEGSQNYTVLLEDPRIYEMNRTMFEFLWQQAS